MTRSMKVSAQTFCAFATLLLAVCVLLAPKAGADPPPHADEHSAAALDAGPPPGVGGGSDVAAQHRTDGTAGTTGVATSAQPLSTADSTGQGANTSPGPYTSTRDGSPSENGNGEGLAVGQPCAGCVGQADNKNPPGQLPNGSDPNAGYECDTNAGIGRTNPAHTGCVTTTGPGPEVVPPVTPPLFAEDVAVSVPVSPGSVQTPALAFTGGWIGPAAMLGVALVLTGALALAFDRRRDGRRFAG